MQIEPIIVKFLSNESFNISEKELKQLEEWIQNPENEKVFVDYVKTNASIESSINSYDAFKAEQRFLRYLKNKKSISFKRKVNSVMKYAAIVVVFLTVGYFWQQGSFSKKQELIIPDNSITLQLENGNIEIINEDGSSQVVDNHGNVIGAQKGNQLIYNNSTANETLAYNTLTVPYGKRFEVLLSDGTHVHLNAGTSLKYPIKFIEGKNRQVFLNGEAYFSVTKDKNHPFIVNADEIDVRVLGTQFNISSYPEDNQINTVLVEGAVAVYKKEEIYNAKTTTNLKPGFKAIWENKENRITVKEADVEMHTAWIEGKIIFRGVTFENIIKKLERHYNVEIINNNEPLNIERFGASFDIETIEQVLETLNANYNIDYTIENNQIIIN